MNSAISLLFLLSRILGGPSRAGNGQSTGQIVIVREEGCYVFDPKTEKLVRLWKNEADSVIFAVFRQTAKRFC